MNSTMVLFTARVSSGLKKSIIISSFAGLMLLLTNSNAAYAVAGINRQINFQGKVVNKTAGTNVANGNYDFTFRLYDAASAGSVLWTENWTAAGGGQLTVTDGIFRVALGSYTTFASANVDFNSDNLYLDITFNGETMGSRIRMTAVPYALNAEKVAGLTVTNNGGNTLNIAANKTFTVNNSITFSGTDSTAFTLPTSGDTLVGLDASQVLTNKTIGNTGLLFENSESISNGTNGTLTFGRNDSGIVTLTAKDDDAVAGLTILPGGAAGLILGGSSMTGLTVTTDSTGNNEVILPDGSIATAEILDASLLPADLDLTTADSAGDEECLTYESSTSDFEWQTCSSAGTNYWQLNAGALSPFSLTADLNLGATATSSAKISLAGSLTRGMAAAIINQTENQDIFTASSSGTTKFTISNLGNVGIRTSPLDNTGLNVQKIGTTFNHLYGVRSNVEVNDGGDYLQDQYGGYFSAGGSGSMDGSYGVYGISTADNFNNDSVGVYGVGGTVGVAGSSGSIGVSGSGGVYGGYFFNDGANGTAVVATQGNGLGLGLSVAGRSEFSAAAHSKALVILNQTGNKDIFTASASGLTKFVISNAGNVGIGDASPDHKLDVEGNMGLSASSYINWGDTDGSGGYGFRDNSGTVEFKNSGGAWIAIPTSAGANYWQLNSGVLTPFSITADTNFGATATASAKISLAGSLTRGKAAAIINQTEDQDIFAASASGTTKFFVTKEGRTGIGTDTIVGSTERLLQVGSKTNRGNAAVYGDIVSQGVSDITGLTNIKDVYVYDTTSDSDGGRWIDWATTDRLSWYSEALDDSPSDPCNIATDDRCYTTNFPRKAILVVTTDALYIFDAATNDMWMKFTQNAAGYALGIDTNNDPSSVTAANGVVYVGTNGASAGGLYVIDFVNDRMWNYDDTDRSGADVGIASRNSAVTYNSDNNTSLDLGGNTGWKTINDVSVAAVNMSSTAIAATTGPGNGSTFVALATDSGVNLINLSQQKLLQYSRITDDNYESVVVTKNARLYALDSTRDELNMWNNIDSDVTSQLNAAADKAWDETTAPALTRTTPVIATGTPDALEVVERGSLSDSGVTAGASSDLIYVGHSQGLTELHDNATLALGWVKYYNIDLQTALMTGTIRRMHMMDDASGNITNQSNQTDIMTAKGTPGYDATGVRGKAISFNGTDEYLCSDTTGDGTCDNDASDNLGTAAWTISTWFKHSTNITGTDVLFARCYNTTPAAAAGCVAASMVASGQMTVNVDFDATFTIGVTGTTVFHTSTQTYNDNQWHHLIVTRAATTGNINTMIDGKPIGQTAGLNTTLDASQILGIGTDCSVGAACGTGGNFWEGSIDDFMLSTGTNNNLSTTVMRRLYNDARPLVGKRVVTVVNATTFSTTTIGDSGEAWIPNEFAGMIVTLTGNTGAGQTRRITGNTATTLTVSPAFSTTPDATTDFEIDPEALYGASNVVTSVGITAESPIGEARQMCVGTNDGSDGGGVTCYNHQAGPNIIADLFHGDSVQTDDSGVEWTGANYDDIRSIDVSGRAIVIGSEAHFYTETSDVRLGQGLDYLANQMFNVKSEILNDGIGTVGSLGVEVGFTGGADIAEYFESDGVMQPGQIVSIHKTITSGVQLADKEYQKDIIGVVATRPGLTLGGQKETSYPVALTGRVPVIIAAESGSVLRGDAITSSNVPGVGKRAIQRGTIVGIALEGNADWDEVNCPVVTSVDEITWPEDDTGSNGARPCFKVITEEKKEMYIGKLMVFMNPGYYQGDEIVTADAVNKSASISVIGAFNAANDDQAVTINTAGEFIIKNSEGETVATVDKYGNMHIADVIHPQKVDMNTIEGMDDYMKRVNILEANVASLSAALEIVSSSSAMFSWDPLWLDIAPRREVSMSATESGLLAIDLSTGSDATVSGKLRVQGSSLFEEMVTMVGDVMMNNILVNGIADFFGKTIFHEDVEIRGKLMVGSDTSGIAIIRKHTDVVDVVFAGVYEEIPLVTTSISLDSIVNEEASKEVQKQQEEAQTKLEQAILNGDIQYVITRKTKRGFVIKLNKRAPEDIQFTWTALASSKLGVSNDSTVLSDKTPVDDSFERESVEPLQTPSPTTHELNEQPERTVTILPSELGYLRVRSGPRSSFDEVGQVRPDASFTVIESQNGWFMIEYDDAKTGWVSSLYVAVKQ